MNIAVIEYEDAAEALPIAMELEDRQGRMLALVKGEVDAGTIRSDTLLLRTNQQYLEAKVKRLTAYGDLIIAKAKIYNSMGRKFEDQHLTAASSITPVKVAKVQNTSVAAQ